VHERVVREAVRPAPIRRHLLEPEVRGVHRASPHGRRDHSVVDGRAGAQSEARHLHEHLVGVVRQPEPAPALHQRAQQVLRDLAAAAAHVGDQRGREHHGPAPPQRVPERAPHGPVPREALPEPGRPDVEAHAEERLVGGGGALQRADDEARAQLPEWRGELRVDPREPVALGQQRHRAGWVGGLSGGGLRRILAGFGGKLWLLADLGEGIGGFGQPREEIAEQPPASHLSSIAGVKVVVFFVLRLWFVFWD